MEGAERPTLARDRRVFAQMERALSALSEAARYEWNLAARVKELRAVKDAVDRMLADLDN